MQRMTDWQLWQEDFAQGYEDCMAWFDQEKQSLAYYEGFQCAVKAKQELTRTMPWLNV